MHPSNFFNDEYDESWDLSGRDPWDAMHTVFDTDMVNAIAKGQIDEAGDVEVAQALARLVHDELRAFGTDGKNVLNDEQMADALRALRAVLGRLHIEMRPPFRDLSTFRDFWSREGMSGAGGWAMRRGYLSKLFEPVWTALDDRELASTSRGAFRGVDGQPKNIIFASSGPKPEIVLSDALNNVIEIVAHGEHCLVYDRPLTDSGLTWGELVAWWASMHGEDREASLDVDTAHDLYRRLEASLAGNDAEKLVFRTYCERYRGEQGLQVPALLPQVYLHFDPLTSRQRKLLGRADYLGRERMDFLLLLPNHVRVVIEVDGKQHYAEGELASPSRYAEMVAEDRRLRLSGYDVYRIGGYELTSRRVASDMLRQFFDGLFMAHGVTLVGS